MSAAERGVLVLPGRGAYTAASLGSLDVEHRWVRRADELRVAAGLPPLTQLDGAPRFDPRLHLQPIHISPLTWLASLLDAERAAADHHITAVLGNSLGWYTALTATGVLDFDDGFALVQELGRLQQEPLPDGGRGGQVIYPLTDAGWQPDDALRASVDGVLAGPDGNGAGRAFPSVELGGYVVLAGDDAGIDRLLRHLAPVRIGERLYPLRLALHGPYHTPLVAHIADEAGRRLAGLRWGRPQVTLIDGRGMRWTPWSTDPGRLRDYTLGEQITPPYRFAASVRVALREEAPDRLVLAGPGNSLGGICGQLIAGEGYHGIRTRADFERAQQRDPLVLSMRR
jgi:acyl transferase domain-containing protein